MATIGTASHANFTNSSRRSYITTAPFESYFYSYNGATLSLVTEASCETCPIGRILRETGRKLYPGANPGVTRYMVGVFDSITFLNGFIHPNDNVFAIYNSDKPAYIPNDNVGNDVEGVVDNYGAPVLTQGNVISSDGFIGIQSTISGGELYAGSYLYKGNFFTTPFHPTAPEDIPIVEAGTKYPNECTDPNFPPVTYATLYPDGMIQSVRWVPGEGEEDLPFPSTAYLTADGDIFNTGNISTIGNTSIGGTLSTIGTSALAGGLSVGNGNLFGKVTTGTLTVVGQATAANHTRGDGHTITVTLTGATTSDIIIVNQKSILSDYVVCGHYVSSANTVTIQFSCVATNANNSQAIPQFLYVLIHPA